MLHLQPATAKVLIKQFGMREKQKFLFQKLTMRPFMRNNAKVASLGSEETIYCSKDTGLFDSVLTAYNHWNLRSSPEAQSK